MADLPANSVELDERIATVRENLRQLVEQAAGYSGAGDEQLQQQRIADQEEQLERLTSMRERLNPAGN
jgi:hypothetical protein